MDKRPEAQTEEKVAISLRSVNKKAWKEFRRLAMLHDMSIQDYLEYLVKKEMEKVSIKIANV